MNKMICILLFGAFGLLAFMHLACGSSPSTTPMTSTGNVTATTSNTFSPSAVTILHGSAVTFALGGGTHSLYIDNGGGTCVQSYTTWPQIITFPTAGTFNFHCQYHSPCGTTSCSSCTGMVGRVVVQ